MPKVIIQKLNPQEITERRIRQWPVWEKEVSRFEHLYDGTEECLFLEGDVIIETEQENYTIVPGDFVTFEDGLKCTWDIRKPVKKHYNFP